MKRWFPLVICAASLHLACATQPPSSHEGSPSTSAHSAARERLPILVSNSAEAEQHEGKVVHVYGRTINSTFLGWSTPALELPTGGIVVLEPKEGGSLDEVRRALDKRPDGGRFLARGKIRKIPPKESQREFAVMTLDHLPTIAVATYDEISVGVWPASTSTSIALAPMVQVPLAGTGYVWWWLSRNAEGALSLESNEYGRHDIKLEEPVEVVNELMALDADGDSLFELVLSLTTTSGKKRAIVVGAGGRRIAALEAKIGSATNVDEIYKALGTYNWTPILSGPNGANVARVLWDTASFGDVPLLFLRLSGMRFYTAEEIMLKGDVRPDQAMLRVRADKGNIVVDARCGNGWKAVDTRNVPAELGATAVPVALTAAREVVGKKWSDVTKVCTQ